MNTEIILPMPELKNALPGFNKLVSRRTTLPVLSCIKISRKADGEVNLQATDLDAHATFTLATSQPGEAVDVLIPLEQLIKAAKCTGPDQNVALLIGADTTKIRYFIGGSSVQQPVNTIPVAEWPQCPEITADSAPLQPGFASTLKEAMQCCSDDPSRLILNGACLDAREPKAHYVVATNGRFLYSANSFTFPFKEEVIIPDSKFINGSGLLDCEPCLIAVQSMQAKDPANDPIKYVSLQSKQWRLVSRQIDGNYPNWKQVIPAIDSKWTKIKLTDTAIDQLLKVIPNLPGKDDADKPIRLRTGKNALCIEAKDKNDQDWTSVEIKDVTVTGRPKETCINRDFLSPVLKFGLSELAIVDEFTPMLCTEDGKRMVIMPLRPPAPPTTKADSKEPDPEPNQPQPTTSAANPPSTEVQPGADKRKTDMAKDAAKTETTKPAEPVPSLIDQIEQIKEALKNVVRDLNGLADAVRQAEKDKRMAEKEVETARTVLKRLQQVSL